MFRVELKVGDGEFRGIYSSKFFEWAENQFKYYDKVMNCPCEIRFIDREGNLVDESIIDEDILKKEEYNLT